MNTITLHTDSICHLLHSEEKAPGFGLALFLSAYLVLLPNVNVLPDWEPHNTQRLCQVLLQVGTAIWLLASRRARAVWLEEIGP